MSTTNESGHEIYLDSLKWWASKAHELPMLLPLARRVLAASQSQSERLFSSAGVISTKKRNSNGADNAKLLVTVKNSWAVVERRLRLPSVYLRCSFVHRLTIGPMYGFRYLWSPLICACHGADGLLPLGVNESVNSR